MQKLLSDYQGEVTFVEAVYGKDLPSEELDRLFDRKLAYRRCGREMSLGEIGCTLSHLKCYRMIAESDEDYALILEDDVTPLRDLNDINRFIRFVSIPSPTVLFLSGDYWYYKKKVIDECYSVASVFDAVGTYAYLINKKAASLILRKNNKGAFVADNWSLFRNQGVHLKAAFPYMIDANIGEFSSTIDQTYFGEIRKNMPWNLRCFSLVNGFVKRMLLRQRKFVSKIRK